MLAFLANFFGYLLNFIYNLIGNYGLAIIFFTILIRLLMLPITIKQQKTMEKTSKIQDELKSIQFKYKSNPEQLNKETMELYKRENMSPFSGCISSIVQIILILSVFYLVRCPLTYMKKTDEIIISDYTSKLEQTTNYSEVQIIKEFGSTDERVFLNMNFLGLDLSNVPSSNLNDFKTLIIPILYVISSVISMKMTMNLQNNKKKLLNEINSEENNKVKEKNEEDSLDALRNSTNTMSYFMPIMSFSISLVAPLGLALYWLMSNVLMIVERIFINKIAKRGENI